MKSIFAILMSVGWLLIVLATTLTYSWYGDAVLCMADQISAFSPPVFPAFFEHLGSPTCMTQSDYYLRWSLFWGIWVVAPVGVWLVVVYRVQFFGLSR